MLLTFYMYVSTQAEFFKQAYAETPVGYYIPAHASLQVFLYKKQHFFHFTPIFFAILRREEVKK